MMNAFLVETPHQLLNAIEAKKFLSLTGNHLIIVLSEEYPKNAFDPLLNWDNWTGIHCIAVNTLNYRIGLRLFRKRWMKRFLDFFDAYEKCLLRKQLDEIVGSLGVVKNIFLGNYWRDLMRHFPNKLCHETLFVLDDGTATILINNERKKSGAPVTEKAIPGISRVGLFIRKAIHGMNTREADRITFFTTYDIEVKKGDSAIKNGYQYLRRMATKVQPDNEVFFLGQPLVEDGELEEKLYMDYLKRIRLYFGKEEVIYVPHKRETVKKIINIERDLGMGVKRFDVPIEYQMSIKGTRPKILASFFSSALENCRVIFDQNLRIKVFYIDPGQFLQNNDFVRDVYDYYRSKISPSFEAIWSY